MVSIESDYTMILDIIPANMQDQLVYVRLLHMRCMTEKYFHSRAMLNLDEPRTGCTIPDACAQQIITSQDLQGYADGVH